jgi:iron complex transport system substrate-binding protein
VLTQLKAAGVAVKIVPSEHSLRGAEDKVRAVAALLDEPQRGEDLVRSIQQRADSVPPVPASTRVVFLFGWGGGTLSVAGRQTAADAMIRLSGATNAIQQYDGYKPISPEALLTASPDVILIASGTWKAIGGTEGLGKVPGVSETVAWRSHRILAVDPLKLLGFGPRTGEAIADLRRALADAMQRTP